MLNTALDQFPARPAASRESRRLAVVAKNNHATDSCSSCCLKSVCLPSGIAAQDLGTLDRLTTAKRRVTRGSAVYRCTDSFEAIYAVRSGAFKNVGVSTKGEEKITGFYHPGDLMGLDAINSGSHQFNGVALEDSEVCVIPFPRLQEIALQIPALQHHVFRLISREISRDHGLMLLLGSMSAEQRLAAFLLSLSRRYQRMGYAADRFNLRMTREDIGNYLGLTLETVSRFLSRFAREGMIAARQRHIEIKDADALLEIVGCW
jgi:CRP/FNR family transcriptional regulator, anaerobic regulatory protein